ncbi:serine protease FAM111A-like [Scomber scombrus]|uniref:serine protease FAM111A-like n=1 Tax=Scomber scombrus TaxID=13677 RepID=UPI002DDA2933|nr:serine protease FAM111A-like [Scomber scombrus]
MGPKVKAKSSGPMDKFVKRKKMAGNQNGESSPPLNLQVDKLQPKRKKMAGNQNGESNRPPLVQVDDKLQVKEVEPHETHSFDWCLGDKKPETITCDKARTVEDVLKTSDEFRKIAKINKDKELVIIRDGKAISSHFPCCLIKGERLTVRYVKAVDEAKQSACVPQRKRPPSKLMIFHVLTKGGKKVVRIMRNPALQREAHINEITVYAYKGEKVKRALKRDGRLSVIVFNKTCALSRTSTNMAMSNLVDDLDGETVKIILRSKSSPPESPPGSLDDMYMVQNESQRSDLDENQDPPQQSATTESVNDNTPQEKTEPNGGTTTLKILHEIPNSKPMQDVLSKQLKDVVNRIKNQRVPKRSRIQNVFHVEYGKNDETCKEVKTMKKLMQLSDSVCQVRVDGSPRGTGFLLFGRFVLTNGHVVKDFYDVTGGQLQQRVTVNFSFESLDHMQGEQGSQANMVVEEIVGGEYCLGVSGHMHDWALLRLRADQTLPDGLLPHFGFLPQGGGICIIGHPGEGVKKIDACFIIPSEKRSQIVERHQNENPEGVWNELSDLQIQLVTKYFFRDVAESVKHNSQALTYESCFYFGSSGSPVFDNHCNVVAMHTGGYHYHNVRGHPQSVIEYGHPLSVIIERIIIQMVENGKLDVLKEYLACSYAQHQNVKISLKKLIESRNLVAFRNAVNNSVNAGDEKLTTFFEFFSQTENPVPMDTARD